VLASVTHLTAKIALLFVRIDLFMMSFANSVYIASTLFLVTLPLN